MSEFSDHQSYQNYLAYKAYKKYKRKYKLAQMHGGLETWNMTPEQKYDKKYDKVLRQACYANNITVFENGTDVRCGGSFMDMSFKEDQMVRCYHGKVTREAEEGFPWKGAYQTNLGGTIQVKYQDGEIQSQKDQLLCEYACKDPACWSKQGTGEKRMTSSSIPCPHHTKKLEELLKDNLSSKGIDVDKAIKEAETEVTEAEQRVRKDEYEHAKVVNAHLRFREEAEAKESARVHTLERRRRER